MSGSWGSMSSTKADESSQQNATLVSLQPRPGLHGNVRYPVLAPIMPTWGPILPESDSDSGNLVPLTGRPPATTAHELAELLRDSGASPKILETTAAWLSGERRNSTATTRGYIRDTSWWIAYTAARGLDLADIDPIEADLYAAALRAAEPELADATRARRLSAASSWYAYLTRAGRARINPFLGMERPRVSDVSATRGMSEDDMERMLAYARERETSRTFAISALLVSTAARDGSIVAARADALGWDRGHRTIDLPVKGGKNKRFILPAFAIEALERYFADRKHSLGTLFTTSTGKPIDQPYLYRLIKRITRAAGVPQVSPHGIRHSVITLLLDKGYPLHVVQDFAGHADPRTTRRYDRARESLDRSPAYDLGQIIAAGVERHAERWATQ